MSRVSWGLAVLLVFGCGGDDADDAGVGSSGEGCEEPGSHSVRVGDHSCACEAGYEWCDDALDSFDCCPAETDEGGDEASGPELPCDEELAEQLVCVADPVDPSPGEAVVWACNGTKWVEVPGYAAFECMAQGLPFAYGCVEGPEFLCGFGPGSSCEVEGYAGVCVDEDIIDTCVWGRRTVDRCSRLCAELEAFGPGFSEGTCEQASPDVPAMCGCS